MEANCERKSILNPFSFILSDNSQLLPVGTVHSSTGTCFSQSFIPASENEFFVYWKQYCFTLEFFLLVETIVETWRKSIFKDETYSCWWTQAFSIFSETLRCFKVEATFPFSGNAFFNKSYIWLLEMDTFCLVETVLFDQSYFSASGSHYWN